MHRLNGLKVKVMRTQNTADDASVIDTRLIEWLLLTVDDWMGY